MAINLRFDVVGNPEPPTIILANRNGNMLGQLKVNEKSIDLSDKLNDASEFSFTMNKYVDGKIAHLWDKVVDFKLVYCKEWDCWFEIKVELDEKTETVKTVYCTHLGYAELSQIKLYNVEINTEQDIDRDDYKISILYDENDPEASILNRVLKDKAPHYSIAYVSPTIAKIQRSFSFDDISIRDIHKEIAEEIGCLFQYYAKIENGVLQRKIAVFDLQQTCNDCGHRGEYTDICPKCGSKNITNGYGEDTLIFVTSDELASSGIQLVTDVDSVKNCFKLEAGDDLMTATVRNCNPNGTDYIWYFSDSVKEDMSSELVEKLNSYNEIYRQYYETHVSNIDEDILEKYNGLVDKYLPHNEDLQKITAPITGYSSLMNAYYNAIDLELYLESGLMPSVEMNGTNAEEQIGLLTSSSLSPVAVADVTTASLANVNSAVLAMAKTIVRPAYKVQIGLSELVDGGNSRSWRGNFIITSYSDEEDTATGEAISVLINDDLESFIKQKLEKSLNKENTDDLSISGLFEKEYDDFCNELKKYALNPLTSFHDACQSCIDIMIDQGVGSGESWSDSEEGSEANLYEKLYIPYYNKLKAIESEIKVREDEISVVSGVCDIDGNLIVNGLRTEIENCKRQIQDALNFENYLGNELWLEFCAYRREDKYSNEKYISDGLNNAELFKRALEFFEIAENEIYKSSELQHSISTSLNNLLAINKFKPLVKSFNVGNWIRVQVDDRIFKLRLLKYEISFSNFDNIDVDFSDVINIKNGTTDVRDVLEQASSMATSYSSVKRQATQGSNAKDTIEQWTSDGLNSALVQIQSNDSEDITFTKNGLLCRSYDDITGTYSPEQLKLTHNIMAYTDDDWKTVRQAIGKHEYIVYSKEDGEFVNKTGYGMHADFVSAGIVSGSQIIGGDIYSNNYSNAQKSGSYLNLTDGTFSFAGGKLTYDGDHLSVDGEITVATTGTIGCWNINEFSIHKGSELFGNANGMYFGTEGLSLGSKFKVDFQGNMTSTSGIVGGWLIEDNYIGLEKWDEENSSNNVAMSPIGVNAYVSALGDYNTCLLYFKDKFAILEDGTMCASNAKISGEITATGGEIGGWEIADWKMSAGDGVNVKTAVVQAPSSDTTWVFAAGGSTHTNYGDSPFRVDKNGNLFATNATIEGKITATSGNFSDNVTIGGTTVTAGYLKALYNYAVGGTGTAIKQIEASKGTIGGWTINDYVLRTANSYINTNGTFYFSPDGSGIGYRCGFLLEDDADTSDYIFVLGSDTKFKIGNTTLTESQLQSLLALI